MKYKRDYEIKNFSVLDKLVRSSICSQHRVFPGMKTDQAVKEGSTVLLQEEVILLSWCCRRLSLIERNLNNWILSTNSFCIKK